MSDWMTKPSRTTGVLVLQIFLQVFGKLSVSQSSVRFSSQTSITSRVSASLGWQMTHSLSSSSTWTVVFFSWQFMVRFTNLTGNYIKYETDLVWTETSGHYFMSWISLWWWWFTFRTVNCNTWLPTFQLPCNFLDHKAQHLFDSNSHWRSPRPSLSST